MAGEAVISEGGNGLALIDVGGVFSFAAAGAGHTQ